VLAEVVLLDASASMQAKDVQATATVSRISPRRSRRSSS